MKIHVIGMFMIFLSSQAAKAIPPIGHPSGPCAGASLCEFNPPQLLVVPAFFPINEHSDPSKPTDWVRIQNQRAWVRTVVALGDSGGFQDAPLTTDCAPFGSGGELCDAKNQFAANRQAAQSVYGYVNTQFGTMSRSAGSPMSSQLQNWQTKYPTQIQGMFLDDGPSFTQSPLSDQQLRLYYTDL